MSIAIEAARQELELMERAIASRVPRCSTDQERERINELETLLESQGEEPPKMIVTKNRLTGFDDVSQANINVKPARLDKGGGFKDAREFLTAIMRHGQGREIMDTRLRPLFQSPQQLAVGSDEARTTSDSKGGFLVPEGFLPTTLVIPAEAAPLQGRTQLVPMERPVVAVPARVDNNHATSVAGGLVVGRKAETVAATASQMTLSQVKLRAHSLFGLTYATEELLTDSGVSFAALVAESFGEQFGSVIMDERINGTGVGEYLGILNSSCLITVDKEVGQAATSLVYENIISMRARCWGYNKAVWIANHDTLPQLMLLNQSVGTAGVQVWQPSAREDHPDSLLGRPLFFTEYAQTLGQPGDLICGDWTQYLEGVLEPIRGAESMHVRFVNHERAFKFWTRNAGHPWWSAVLTPKNGAATLSPFIVLAARA